MSILISMEEVKKLVCRKTLISMEEGIRVNLFEPRFRLVRNEKRFDEKADFSTLPFSLDIFNSMSKSCIDTHAPLCRTKITRPPTPWLNTDDIEQLQNKRNELSYLT